MKWTRISSTVSDSDKGYRIRAFMNPDKQWRFMCYGPDIGYQELNRRMKVRYERGEQVPARCELIGKRETGKAAADACEQHWREKNGD